MGLRAQKRFRHAAAASLAALGLLGCDNSNIENKALSTSPSHTSHIANEHTNSKTAFEKWYDQYINKIHTLKKNHSNTIHLPLKNGRLAINWPSDFAFTYADHAKYTELIAGKSPVKFEAPQNTVICNRVVLLSPSKDYFVTLISDVCTGKPKESSYSELDEAFKANNFFVDDDLCPDHTVCDISVPLEKLITNLSTIRIPKGAWSMRKPVHDPFFIFTTNFFDQRLVMVIPNYIPERVTKTWRDTNLTGLRLSITGDEHIVNSAELDGIIKNLDDRITMFRKEK